MGVDLVVLFRDLVRLETEVWNRLGARVRQVHRVPLAWLEVMQVVDAIEGCRVLDIARTLSITVGGASKVVDRVESAGYCRRQPNRTDGRSNVILLTESGGSLLAEANVTFKAELAALLGAAAPPDELAQLSIVLGRLRQHLATRELLQSAGRH